LAYFASGNPDANTPNKIEMMFVFFGVFCIWITHVHHFDFVSVSLSSTSSLALDENHENLFFVIFMSLCLFPEFLFSHLEGAPWSDDCLASAKQTRVRTHTHAHTQWSFHR